jgi:hypothetical protein
MRLTLAASNELMVSHLIDVSIRGRVRGTMNECARPCAPVRVLAHDIPNPDAPGGCVSLRKGEEERERERETERERHTHTQRQTETEAHTERERESARVPKLATVEMPP